MPASAKITYDHLNALKKCSGDVVSVTFDIDERFGGLAGDGENYLKFLGQPRKYLLNSDYRLLQMLGNFPGVTWSAEGSRWSLYIPIANYHGRTGFIPMDDRGRATLLRVIKRIAAPTPDGERARVYNDFTAAQNASKAGRGRKRAFRGTGRSGAMSVVHRLGSADYSVRAEAYLDRCAASGRKPDLNSLMMM